MATRILTCALTGGAPIQNNPAVPVTPKDIAQQAIDAGKAGASIAHIHVRDPRTGLSSMELDLYREVVRLPVVANAVSEPRAIQSPNEE